MKATGVGIEVADHNELGEAFTVTTDRALLRDLLGMIPLRRSSSAATLSVG